MTSIHQKLTQCAAAQPVRVGITMAVLTILLVVLIVKAKVYKARWDECRGKNGFLTPGIGNFEIAGMNPVWWGGSMAAGGLFGTDADTPQQLAAYEPRFRRSVQRRAAKKRILDAQIKRAMRMRGGLPIDNIKVCGPGQYCPPPNSSDAEGGLFGGRKKRGDWPPVHAPDGSIAYPDGSIEDGALFRPDPPMKEGMHNPPCSAAEYQSVDAEGNRICLEPGEAWTSGCVAGWDPAAVAEAQGLSAAGGVDTMPDAEGRLREAANAVYDTEDGLNSAQITELYSYNNHGI